jgi:hypothetical protein
VGQRGQSKRLLALGQIDHDEYMACVAASAPSIGHCNTMGTALSMNSLAEALGMSLPGCAATPAPYSERAQMAAAAVWSSPWRTKISHTPRGFLVTRTDSGGTILIADFDFGDVDIERAARPRFGGPPSPGIG